MGHVPAPRHSFLPPPFRSHVSPHRCSPRSMALSWGPQQGLCTGPGRRPRRPDRSGPRSQDSRCRSRAVLWCHHLFPGPQPCTHGTERPLLCCGPGPKCTGGLAFVKEQDKSVPQCRGNKVSRLTLGREPVGNRSRALREGPFAPADPALSSCPITDRCPHPQRLRALPGLSPSLAPTASQEPRPHCVWAAHSKQPPSQGNQMRVTSGSRPLPSNSCSIPGRKEVSSLCQILKERERENKTACSTPHIFFFFLP